MLGSNIGGVDGNYFAPEIWVLNEEIKVSAQALTFTDLAFLTYATSKIDTNDPFPIQTMFRVAPTGKVGIVSRDAAGNATSIKRPTATPSGFYTDTNGWYGESAHPQIGRIMVFLQPTSARSVQSWLRENAVLYGGDTGIKRKRGLFELGDVDFDKVLNVTANGSYSVKPNAPYSTFGRATVNVNVPVPSVQDTKALTITSNGTVSVTPDAPYDALKKVVVEVDVQPTNFKQWTYISTGNNEETNIATLVPAGDEWIKAHYADENLVICVKPKFKCAPGAGLRSVITLVGSNRPLCSSGGKDYYGMYTRYINDDGGVNAYTRTIRLADASTKGNIGDIGVTAAGKIFINMPAGAQYMLQSGEWSITAFLL